ncbi:hypothetical protein Q1695_012374 [Nippostrongylus brasiliensis]|nr:hypothetical protein Q1695_012374 [Nippostrongylus brasiliensis]
MKSFFNHLANGVLHTVVLVRDLRGPYNRVLENDRRTQRSHSFQKREEMSVGQVLRRTSNSVAPLSAESMSRSHPTERRFGYDDVPREVNGVPYREMPSSLLRYHDNEYGGPAVSYDGMLYYDPVQETDILGDDVSEGQSDVYGPGRYVPGNQKAASFNRKF